MKKQWLHIFHRISQIDTPLFCETHFITMIILTLSPPKMTTAEFPVGFCFQNASMSLRSMKNVPECQTAWMRSKMFAYRGGDPYSYFFMCIYYIIALKLRNITRTEHNKTFNVLGFFSCKVSILSCK